MKVYVKGLNSCGMRQVDVQRYRDHYKSLGHTLVDTPEEADKIFLWTCGFRSDSRDNSLSEVGRYTKQYDAELIVGGCLPSIDKRLVQSKHCGELAIWKKQDFGDLPRKLVEPRLCEDAEQYRKDHPDSDVSFADQFIKVFCQHGCNFQCTYCSERLAFPEYESYPPQDIFEALRAEIKRSEVYEVMLIGDSIGDYGKDIDLNFSNLISYLGTIHGKIRFAIQGLNPANFIDFYDSMPGFLVTHFSHLAIPIQSASDKILHAMNRPYDRADIDKVFTLLNEWEFPRFDTHLIFGFPGETEEDVDETIAFILKHKASYVLLIAIMCAPSMPSFGLYPKVPAGITRDRIGRAAKKFKAARIICNEEDSQMSHDRFAKINRSN